MYHLQSVRFGEVYQLSSQERKNRNTQGTSWIERERNLQSILECTKCVSQKPGKKVV